MRGIVTYLAGTLAVLALAMIVPASWLGLPVRARAVVDSGTALQSVNRAAKSDRLIVPVTVIRKQPAETVDSQKQQAPVVPVKILDGCDPVFSPLSSGARANQPGRCAA